MCEAYPKLSSRARYYAAGTLNSRPESSSHSESLLCLNRFVSFTCPTYPPLTSSRGWYWPWKYVESEPGAFSYQ